MLLVTAAVHVTWSGGQSQLAPLYILVIAGERAVGPRIRRAAHRKPRHGSLFRRRDAAARRSRRHGAPDSAGRVLRRRADERHDRGSSSRRGYCERRAGCRARSVPAAGIRHAAPRHSCRASRRNCRDERVARARDQESARLDSQRCRAAVANAACIRGREDSQHSGAA